MKRAFILFLSSVAFILHAQKDSLARPEFYRLPVSDFRIQENHFGEDTLLDNHFNYFEKDYNGNTGLPSQEVILKYGTPDAVGFRYFVAPYTQHLFNQNDIAFYKTTKPYTRALAVVGQRQEQLIRLLHTQNIKRFNYMLKFNRYKNNGFYRQQTVITDNFCSTINYQNKNNKYKISSWLMYNKHRHNENGGIENDTLLEFFLNDNKELVDISLRDARRAVKNLFTGVKQEFLIAGNDSSASTHYLYHDFSYKGDYFVYDDENPDAGFYDKILIDSTTTNDSAHIRKFTNTAGYLLRLNKVILKTFYLNYRNEISRARQHLLDTSVMNHIATAGIGGGKNNLSFYARSEYVVSGNNAGDGLIQASGNYIGKQFVIYANLFAEQREADVYYSVWYGNHQQWKNNFEKVGAASAQVRGEFLKKRLIVESVSRKVQNLIYFFTPDYPLQTAAGAFMQRVSIEAKLKLKAIRLNVAGSYQYTDRGEIVSLSPVVGRAQLYFDKKLFKGNLHLQTGFQATYHTAFDANAYMPSTNVFYVSGRKGVGNYPFVDFFINAEIKPVRFFFKMDHVNQGLSGSNYFLTPSYPMPDRAFKFGFTWLFWD